MLNSYFEELFDTPITESEYKRLQHLFRYVPNKKTKPRKYVAKPAPEASAEAEIVTESSEEIRALAEQQAEDCRKLSKSIRVVSPEEALQNLSLRPTTSVNTKRNNENIRTYTVKPTSAEDFLKSSKVSPLVYRDESSSFDRWSKKRMQDFNKADETDDKKL